MLIAQRDGPSPVAEVSPGAAAWQIVSRWLDPRTTTHRAPKLHPVSAGDLVLVLPSLYSVLINTAGWSCDGSYFEHWLELWQAAATAPGLWRAGLWRGGLEPAPWPYFEPFFGLGLKCQATTLSSANCSLCRHLISTVTEPPCDPVDTIVQKIMFNKPEKTILL